MSKSVDLKSKRPLSPHLQVYNLPYNAVMSITGRGVGVGLAKAIVFVLAWFVAVVWYPPVYDITMTILDMPIVGYFLLLVAFVVFFYLGNGVRHVLWDFTIGVHHNTGRLTGNIALVSAVLLTALIWALSSGFLG